jgi:hypothetical protein
VARDYKIDIFQVRDRQLRGMKQQSGVQMVSVDTMRSGIAVSAAKGLSTEEGMSIL